MPRGLAAPGIWPRVAMSRMVRASSPLIETAWATFMRFLGASGGRRGIRRLS